MDKRNHDRAKGQETLSISLPVALKQRIAVASKRENRTVSNWFCTHVEKLLESGSENFLLSESQKISVKVDGGNTPLEKAKPIAATKEKPASAKKAPKFKVAGAEIVNPSEISDGGLSTAKKGTSRRTG